MRDLESLEKVLFVRLVLFFAGRVELVQQRVEVHLKVRNLNREI